MTHTAEKDARIEAAIQVLVRVERENAINCTGLGEVGCNGRAGWHSWSAHRLHVAAAQVTALIEASVIPPGEVTHPPTS